MKKVVSLVVLLASMSAFAQSERMDDFSFSIGQTITGVQGSTGTTVGLKSPQFLDMFAVSGKWIHLNIGGNNSTNIYGLELVWQKMIVDQLRGHLSVGAGIVAMPNVTATLQSTGIGGMGLEYLVTKESRYALFSDFGTIFEPTNVISPQMPDLNLTLGLRVYL